MSHPFVHIEIPVNDLESGGAFYEQLFGWQTRLWPEMDYMTFNPGEGPGGGFAVVDGQRAVAGRILVHVGTDDVSATLARAESLGATTAVPRTEIPQVGWFGVFIDPAGNPIALFEPLPGSM